MVDKMIQRDVLLWMSWEKERYYMIKYSCRIFFCVCVLFFFLNYFSSVCCLPVSLSFQIASWKLNLHRHYVKLYYHSKRDLGGKFSVACGSHRLSEGPALPASHNIVQMTQQGRNLWGVAPTRLLRTLNFWWALKLLNIKISNLHLVMSGTFCLWVSLPRLKEV